ncbi:nucleotide disphospho-sugar-binding domain-containing protein [Micromonospora sp. BRA006-A]|nr:nucleotide disphospho-sugar-binding domain-containing protein [Micromonospora sp. BRA006-A]
MVATLDTRQLASMPTLPANVRAVDFVPLNALLPTCSALISHGGSGTMSTALARGVPQLVVPSKIWDSADKARRLAEQGAGICLTEVTASAVRESVVALLEQPSYAENAARLRREAVATPSPVEVVPLLERLTAEHRRHRPAVRPFDADEQPRPAGTMASRPDGSGGRNSAAQPASSMAHRYSSSVNKASRSTSVNWVMPAAEATT